MNKQKLFQKDFTLVVIGQIISLFGNAILRFALPLYLLRTTGSAALFGIVTACSFLPMIVLSLLGGVLADRINKRNIMVGLDFSTALLITIFYLMLGKLPLVPLLIVVLMMLYGISGTYQPAVQASIPALVNKDKLLSANAVVNQIGALANLLGPVTGGMLFGAWGITPILIISIICFLLSAIMEIFITIPYTKRDNSQGILAIVKGDLGESIHFVREEKPVFIQVAVIIGLLNMVLSALIIVGTPVLIVTILGMTDGQLGISQGALACGGLAGGIMTAILGKRLKVKNSYLLLTAGGICVAGMGIMMRLAISDFVSYLGITVIGFFVMAIATMFSIQIMTLVQAHTPAHLVGKVMACLMAFVTCASPLGQAIYGLLFERFRSSSEYVLWGCGFVTAVISIYSKKVFKKLHDM